MNRCFFLRPAAVWLLVGLLGLLTSPWALAQSTYVRSFPADALRGTLVVVQPPTVTMNDQEDRLSPGARIRGTNNLLVMSASLVGQTLTVNYTREINGLIHDVWILTDAEAADKRATGTTPTTIIIVPRSSSTTSSGPTVLH